MHCHKCSGRMFVDRMFNDNLHIEVFCIQCGKRKFVKRDGNTFGRWLDKKETMYKRVNIE